MRQPLLFPGWRYCTRCGEPREPEECICSYCSNPEFETEPSVTFDGWKARQRDMEQVK